MSSCSLPGLLCPRHHVVVAPLRVFPHWSMRPPGGKEAGGSWGHSGALLPFPRPPHSADVITGPAVHCNSCEGAVLSRYPRPHPPAHTQTHTQICCVSSSCHAEIMLRGRKGCTGRTSQHCCSANNAAARCCMIVNTMDSVEMIGRLTHTHTPKASPYILLQKVPR